MAEKEQGLRFNTGKLRWSLVDFESLVPMVQVLEFGAQKYDDHNWKKGMPITQISESLMRHSFAFLGGEDNDRESGLPHIGHILCNAMFISYMIKNCNEHDDRYGIDDKPNFAQMNIQAITDALRSIEDQAKALNKVSN